MLPENLQEFQHSPISLRGQAARVIVSVFQFWQINCYTPIKELLCDFPKLRGIRLTQGDLACLQKTDSLSADLHGHSTIAETGKAGDCSGVCPRYIIHFRLHL